MKYDTPNEKSTEPTDNTDAVAPRVRRALTEYMTVLVDDETDLAEVYSSSGTKYTVDLRTGSCDCPDATHNLDGDERCKHALRARWASGRDPVPARLLDAIDVDDNMARWTDEEVRVAATDGGVIEAGDDAEVLTEEENEDTGGVRDPYAHRDEDVDTTPLGTVDDEDEDEDECETCAELSDDLPCFECWMNERGHAVGGGG